VLSVLLRYTDSDYLPLVFQTLLWYSISVCTDRTMLLSINEVA